MRLHPVRRQIFLRVSGVVLFGGFAAVLSLSADRFDAPRTGAALVICVAFCVLWLTRINSWSATVDPEPGAEALSADALRQRILTINALKVPFRVREDGERLVVAWKPRGAKSGKVESIILNLDEERRRVRAQESEVLPWVVSAGTERDPATGAFVAGAEECEASVEAGVFVGVKAEASFTRRIPAETYVHGARVGLAFEEGAFNVLPHDYRFVILEIRQPLVELIVRSGWSYVPVL